MARAAAALNAAQAAGRGGTRDSQGLLLSPTRLALQIRGTLGCSPACKASPGSPACPPRTHLMLMCISLLFNVPRVLCWLLEPNGGWVDETVGALQAQGHHRSLQSPPSHPVLLQQSKSCARGLSWHDGVTQPPKLLDDVSLAGSRMLVPSPGETPKPHLPESNCLRCIHPARWQRRCPRTESPGLVTPDHPHSMGNVPSADPGHFHLSPMPQSQWDGASEPLGCSRTAGDDCPELRNG